jgi:hypothetical protein
MSGQLVTKNESVTVNIHKLISRLNADLEK